jgi:signal transduction histidine kinase
MYRGDKSRSQRGLGLGLSLVKAIVEAHQGEVSVDSEPGSGAAFTVVLPKY